MGVLVVALVAALVAPVARAGSGEWHTWSAPTGGAFREAAYVGGELVYTNGVHIAAGANSDRTHRDEYTAAIRPASEDVHRLTVYDLFGTHRALHNGDYVLPTDAAAYPDFTGEIAELRLAADDDELFVRWRFTSMPRPDAQIATLAFATEGASTPASDWPRGANVRSPWSATVTAWGSGAALDRRDGSGRTLDVRTGAGTVEVRVPLADLPPAPWSLTGGAGLHDPITDGQYWFVPPGVATPATPGNLGVSDAAVWSLLFARDQPWTFDDERQADMLWQGDASQARVVVDLGLLQSGATRLPAVRTGRMSRLFESRLDLGEGIDRTYLDFVDRDPGVERAPLGVPGHDTARWFQYLGRLQPYSLYVPSAYPATTAALPLVVYLHGLNGLHDEPFGPVLGLEQEAEERGYLLAGALGRGDHLYRGPGEVDVLEVIADIRARYRVDPDRIYLMGHSMGSQGTYSVALRNPDLFAAAVSVSTFASGELVPNGRNLPWLHIGSTFDADAGSEGAKQLYEQRSAQGWDSALVNFESKTHEYSQVYDALPRIFRFFDSHRRVHDPAVVHWVVPDDEDPTLGLTHDGAYWLSAVEGPAGSMVEVETFGLPHGRVDLSRSVHAERMIDEGGRSGGDTKAKLWETIPVFHPPLPLASKVVITTSHVTALTLDVARMGVSFTDVDLDITSAGPMRITLVNGSGETRVIEHHPS